MKKFFSKKFFALSVAAILCLCIAGVSIADTQAPDSTRTVVVDSSNVLQDNYEGVGDNLWSAPYTYDMNAAYQLVNNKRTETVEPALVRMIFLPGWLVDLSQPAEQQQYNWEHGIYNWDSVECQNFWQKVAMFQAAGTKVQVNMGGRVHSEMSGWFSIKDVTLSEAGTRSAPANLEAFAQATSAVFQKAYELGYNNVSYLSFYNEVNGGNYEAFADKRIYWCKMIELVHYQLKADGIRDKIKICGTELAGFINESPIAEFLSFVVERLGDGDEDGDPIYDFLSVHQYQWAKDYDTLLSLSKQMGEEHPGIYITEYSVGQDDEGQNCINFKQSEVTSTIVHAKCGYGGSLSWFFCGDTAPNPMNVPLNGIGSVMWRTPSLGLDQVGQSFGEKGIMMRYIPKNSKIVDAQSDSDDLLCAAYTTQDGKDCTVLLESDSTAGGSELTVKLGNEANGKIFERHVYKYPVNEDGLSYRDELYDNGNTNAILPVTDRYIECVDGKLVDTLPEGHCAIIYTTLDEEVQIELETCETELKSGEFFEFKLKNIFGSDETELEWSVVGKCSADDAYTLITDPAVIGSVDNNGKYLATGTAAGDTVAIRCQLKNSPDTYNIAIVKIVE